MSVGEVQPAAMSRLYLLLLLACLATLAIAKHDKTKDTDDNRADSGRSSGRTKDQFGGISGAGIGDSINGGHQKLLERLGYTTTLQHSEEQLKPASRRSLWQQKFLLDVLLNINGDLISKELIAMGEALEVDKNKFDGLDDDMLQLLQLCVAGRALRQGETFNPINKQHLGQLLGLQKLLLRAKSWTTFQQVACFARQHLNGQLVANALVLAVSERADTRDLIVPQISDILPELFYDERLVVERVQDIDLAGLLGESATQRPTWRDWIGVAHQSLGVGHGGTGAIDDLRDTQRSGGTRSALGGIDATGAKKTWQEWRAESMQKQRDRLSNIGWRGDDNQKQQPKMDKIILTLPPKWNNKHKLDERISYLTGDVSLNSLWYVLGLKDMLTVAKNVVSTGNGDIGSLKSVDIDRILKWDRKDRSEDTGESGSDESVEEPRTNRRGEWWRKESSEEEYKSGERPTHRLPRSLGKNLQQTGKDIRQLRVGEIYLHNIQQLNARLQLEKLSHVAEDMQKNVLSVQRDDMNGKKDKHGKETKNSIESIDLVRVLNEMDTLERRFNGDTRLVQKLQSLQSEILQVFQQEIRALLQLKQQEGLQLGNNRLRNILGELLLGRLTRETGGLDPVKLWAQTQRTLSEVNLTEMGRQLENPIISSLTELLLQIIEQINERLPAYKQSQLILDGVQLNDVLVDRLQTYCDTVDGDIINLLPLDQQLKRGNNLAQLQKLLVARQQRLNHRNFNIKLDLTSQRTRNVVIRILLGPRLDAARSIGDLNEIRQRYVLLDAFATTLRSGRNLLRRNSREILQTSRDATPLTQLYKRTMLAIDNTEGLRLDQLHSRNCRLPNRLLLPRGISDGLPLQLLIVVTEQTGDDLALQQQLPDDLVCGLGTATINLDTLPLNFPLDRLLEDLNQLSLPNVLLKDVLIFHEN